MNPDTWKAAQRDWLLAQLRAMRNRWHEMATTQDTVFCTDAEHDKTAKGRTGGCANELDALLAELL